MVSEAGIPRLLPYDGSSSRWRKGASAFQFKYQLRHHDLPDVAAQARPVLGLRAFPVPGGDGENAGVDPARAGRGGETPGELAHHHPVVVQKLPAATVRSHLQTVARPERGDGLVRRMNWVPGIRRSSGTRP